MSDRRSVQTSSFYIRDSSGRTTMHPRADSFRRSRATRLVPGMDLLPRILAIDAEFQIVYDETTKTDTSVLGRISTVNYNGKPIYDVFVHIPYEAGKKMNLPPAVKKIGVYWKNVMAENGAVAIEGVG